MIRKVNKSIIVGYISEKFAKKNKKVKIEGIDGIWVIKNVYQSLEDKYCIERSQDYKNQRKESDV